MSQYISYSSRNSSGGGGVSSLNGQSGALSLVAGSNITITPGAGTLTIASTGGGSGTVTSVALTDATNLFNITGSPVTTSGTLTLSSFQSQAQNAVFAGPSGSAGAPTFRALVSSDIPSLSALYANVNLSNLGVTAVNADILAGAANIINIGNTSTRFASMIANFIIAGNQALNMNGSQTTPSGITNTPSIYTIFQNGKLAMFSANDANADSIQTGNLYIESGNKTAGTGNSGDIGLTIGTSSGGLRGKIRLKDGSEGTSGQVWTSTDTTGGGHWAASGGSGTVTSVALADSTGLFNITGSPVTSSGTLTLASFQSQTANSFFSAPNGSSGAPTFRLIVAADVPTLNQNTTGTASNITAASNSTLTTLSALSLPASQLTGQVSVANGGTAATTAAAAFNNLNPMTTTGDLIYESATNVASRLPIGTVGQVLTVSGGIPTWLPAPGTASAFFASSQITTDSTTITGTSFATFSNSPALTFTPTITGTYKVYCSGNVANGSSSGLVAFSRIINTSGSATLLYESIADNNGTASANLVTSLMMSVYTLTAGVSYVFDIQGKVQSGGAVGLNAALAPFYLFAELEVSGVSSISFAAFGSTPNANGGSVSSNVITLQPASASFSGGVSTTTQTFAGDKTFSGTTTDTGNTLIANATASEATIGIVGSTAIHDLNGGIEVTTRTITANLTVDTTTTDYIIFCNQSGAITVTLPSPTSGRQLVIKDISGNASTNNITVAQHAAEKIDGVAASYVHSTNNGSLTITSDGTDWWLI